MPPKGARAPTLPAIPWSAPQRARLQKNTGEATDVAWADMDLPEQLAYTWKSRGEGGYCRGSHG